MQHDFFKQAQTILGQEGILMDDSEPPFVLVIDEMKIKIGLVKQKKKIPKNHWFFKTQSSS